MNKNPIGPISGNERIEVIDVLRGMAICGILIGNLQWFSGYGFMQMASTARAPFTDQITQFFVHFLIEGKFYSIFSFLFGIGFALQIARAEERGDDSASLFKRRLFWLLIIGLLHAYLIWPGDILSIYAVMGFLLILFRKKTNESLIKWILVLTAIPILTYVLLFIAFMAFAPPGAGSEQGRTEFMKNAITIVATGDYLQIQTGYNLQYIVGRYLGLIFEMRLPKIFAMFLLGFYAYRRGLFQNPSEHMPLIRRVLIYGLVLGLVGNIAFALLAGSEAVLPPTAMGIAGVITYAFGVPALALFYIAMVVSFWQKPAFQKVLCFLAPVGRMALTNYLMQTLICVTIFYGYGFGQFGKYGAASATLFAVPILMFQIVFSILWLRYFKYGPFEWVWRQLTYGKRLSLLKGR